MENPPGFIFPHTDTPKTYPILGPNLRRKTFGGVCNTPLHGYMKNLAGFIFPHLNTSKTHPILGANPRRRTFWGVCFCAPTRVRTKFGGFHIPAHDMARNPTGFGLCHSTWRETRRVLDPNLRRGLFRGVCNTPLHEYMQNLAGFIFPHPDTPKTRPVLGLNLWRGTFRGVCFCAPTRVRAKPARFHTSAHGYTKNTPDFILPNKDTPKPHPVLGANRRRGVFRGVCNTPLHGYVKNPPGFRRKSSAQAISGRMQ